MQKSLKNSRNQSDYFKKLLQQKAERKACDSGEQYGQQGPFYAAGFIVYGEACGRAGPVKQAEY